MKKNKPGTTVQNSQQKTNVATAPQLQLQQCPFKLTRLDYIAAPMIAVVAFLLAFPYVGTTINWDDLLYMSLSQHTVPSAEILNRYGHIYLQKFFYRIVGDAIFGTRLYWCFLIFTTALLVYWCAKILSGRKGCIIGIIAVLMFCSQPLFSQQLGCTLADFTIMFLAMLAVFIYLAFLYPGNKYRHLIVIMLGLLFFWATKSKETGVCTTVLFLGLGREPTNNWSIRRFSRDIGLVCIGMLAGCLLLMICDLAAMGDAFFSIRPANLLGVLKANFKAPTENVAPYYARRPLISWYTGMSSFPVLAPLFAPFLLYLLIGWKSPGRLFSKHEKVVWLLPLVIVIFLSFIRSVFNVLPRYFALGMPVVCIWAAQFFHFDITGSPITLKNNKRISRPVAAAALILLAFIIVSIIMSYMPSLINFYKRPKEPQAFYAVAIMPLAVTLLLMVAGLSRKRGLIALFLSSLCLFLLIFPPLGHNISSVSQKTVAQKSRWRFEPYRVFADELKVDKNVKILVSQGIHKRSWMLGRDVRGHCWTFNVFFNQYLDYDNFIDGTWEDILKAGYTYAILTWQDWNGIREKNNVDHLLKAYTLKPDKSTQLILMKKR